jgi:pilus assembly protein CpaF
MSVGMQSGMIRGNPGESNWVSRLFQANDRLEHQELKFTLHRKLLERVNLELLATIDTDSAREDLRVILSRLVDEEKTPLSMMEKERVTQEVLDEVFGLGPLEPLLQDRSISDILVTTPYLVVVERNGRLERTSVQFKDNAHLLRIIEKIVSRVGRRVDESSPMVDARLPDGSRVNAIIPPLAVDGPLLSIRRFGRSPLTPDKLIANHSVTPEMIQLLHACVRARLNIVISGGTGSGKTTLLNALSSFIPETERIVTIEDAAELQLNQWHVARLETRPPNVEGKGAIRQRELVINALRMRPDRIVVGETRGEEAIDMLQAMNTGHDGSLTTIHANSPRDGLSRLEVMVGMANANMGVRAIRQQIASAVDVIIQVSRMSDGTRRVTHITECVGMEGEQVTTQDIFNFIKTGISQDGRVLGRFQPTGVRPRFYEKLVTSGMHLPASVFETVLEIV